MSQSQPLFRFLVMYLFVLLISLITTPSAKEEPKPGARLEPIPNSRPRFDSVRTNLNDYIWPTDASHKVTSSFAEYRSTHFHGGIDISTNGHTGYKVFAVRDGFIYRISISPNGYGKMLYIKHPDGYVTTYAHLQSFNDSINSIVREEQYRRGTYAIDLVIDTPRILVKQGEIVAYTGDTGFGPPHLHFELRDENLNPVNPMLCENFSVKDDIPPSIRRLMISPLTPYSTVNDGFVPKFFSRFPRNRHTLRIPQVIHVQGQIGFGVEALDRTDGTWSKAGIHRMELYLDDSLSFAMQLDRVPAEETKMIDLDYDFPTIYRGRGKFQKLYIDLGNALPFYEHRPEGSGIVNTEKLTEGEHQYKIVCKDIAGNRTELVGRLLVNRKPKIQMQKADEDAISLSGTNLASIDRFYIFGKKLSEQGWTQHTLTNGRFERDSNQIKIPVNTKQYDMLKIIGETAHKVASAPLFYFIKKPQGSNHEVTIDYDILNDYVRVYLTSRGLFSEVPACIVVEGPTQQTVELEAAEPNKYTGIFVPTDSFAGPRSIRVDAEVNGEKTSTTTSFELYSIPTGTRGSFIVDNGNLTISYDSAAVFRPLHMRIQTQPSHYSSIYSLEPEDVLLNKGIRVSLPPQRDAQENHLALYFRSTAGWVFQTSVRDTVRNVYSSTLTRTLGEVALMRDDEPPNIGRLRVFPYHGKPHIGFSYFDNLSGVDPDEIKLYIDEKIAIPEIDGEHHRVWYQADQRLERGKHTLLISMKDRMKNETHISRIFTIR